MIITKEYIGKHEDTQHLVDYYMIKKDSMYGIELLTKEASALISTIEWFSEDRERTLQFTHLLCSQGASPIHLSELVDNQMQ